MKIKKIAMVGFKSFMDKLEVPVASGLSAIVGPNGCGKSNIVDAIRWAMGEQSAKLLRGRNMEDVIFNGADNVKPLGMAEVSLIFENGDGSFPTQYAGHSELSITRRLYRSGESEYLINNVPCRLKDIQEVFMDTGLGNRAYSIIGQGRISTIIEQKPEETRAMIEEAAGITKYKKKVEESQRKMELTRVNLERVEDILIEVERQMRSLKRQAAKAERFKKIGNEIKELEIKVHAHAFKELNTESGLRVKSAEGLVAEELAKSTEFSTLQANIETMNLELEEKDRKIQALKNDYGQLKERVQKKESNLEFMAREKQIQVESEIRLKTEREDLGRRLTELQEERALLLDKIAKAKESFISLEDEMGLLEKRLKSRQDLLKEVKEQYEEARTRVHSGKTKEMSLTQESGYLNKRIGEITDGKSRLEKEKEEVRRKSAEFAGASERKTEVRQALEQKLQAILADIAREQARRNELQEQKKKLEADLKAAENELNLSRSRLQSLRSLTENFEGYKVGVRTIMKAGDLEAQRTGRILGLVADVIQVEPQYEQAVESVLADKLQHIIVENIRDGREAIEYLKTHAKGRSSFVPLKELREDQAKQNGLPLLRNLIKTEARYQPILNVLLGNAALVDNLEQAINAWQNTGNDYCLVTRDGDIIEKNGVISGGKISQNTQGILARKREITELEQKVIESETKVNGLTGQVNAFDLEIGNGEALSKKLAEEKEECQEKVNELDKALFRLSHESDQLAKLAARIADEIESKDKEQGHHKEALTKIESELLVCRDKRRQHEDYFSEKETELKESEAEFEQFRNELSDRKMEFGRLQEGERGLAREVERIDDFSKNAQTTFERIEPDIQAAKKRHQQCVEQEEMIREELQTFFGKLKTAEETVNGAEQERGEFRNVIRQEEHKAEALRNEVDALKERIHRAQMEQSDTRHQMESLTGIIKEKYNLALAEIYQDYLVEEFNVPEVQKRVDYLKNIKEKLGEVNLTAIHEHEALKERFVFIGKQKEDLLNAIQALNEAIRKINKTSLEKFTATFDAVNQKLKEVFPILFNGGTAALRLMDETKPLESGVLVEVQPPGKKLSHMGLLSGGEKALVAMALIFAIYLIKPSPFCLLDEVDAPLDEANVGRFNNLLREIRKHSQIIVVTHNRSSMEIVDRLYGVTMEKKGISKMVSVNLQAFQNN